MNYLDNNATCPLLPVAREAWLDAVERFWANPSSASQPAALAREHLAACRAEWANAFSCQPENIVFTAGATEASNAIISYLAQKSSSTTRILLSPFEHPAVLEPAKHWFSDRVDYLELNEEGSINLPAVEAQLASGNYALLALMAANNETGLLQPVDEVARLCRISNTPMFCDAAQWIGKLPAVDLPQVDFLTVSAHKFGGPRGCGVLVLSDSVGDFRGRLGGGQEHGHHSGTESLESIAAMTAAFRSQPKEGWSADGLGVFLKAIDGAGYEVVGAGLTRLPNTVALLLPRHRSLRWLPRLERLGFIVSSGSACATGKEGPSHVMKALGYNNEEALRVIRISGGPETTEKAWLGLREALDTVLEQLDRDSDSSRLVTVIDPEL
jgi:cysteine desulfurase